MPTRAELPNICIPDEIPDHPSKEWIVENLLVFPRCRHEFTDIYFCPTCMESLIGHLYLKILDLREALQEARHDSE